VYVVVGIEENQAELGRVDHAAVIRSKEISENDLGGIPQLVQRRGARDKED
jgi:hypothetical protein